MGFFVRIYMRVCKKMVTYLGIKRKYTWQKNARISCSRNDCKYTWEKTACISCHNFETNGRPYYAPRWLSMISYPTRPRGIIVNYIYIYIYRNLIRNINVENYINMRQYKSRTPYIDLDIYFVSCENMFCIWIYIYKYIDIIFTKQIAPSFFIVRPLIDDKMTS